jgi:2-desacetyl-2-hydroxyethyl bacteriochlorophyllide A dehydrogenase
MRAAWYERAGPAAEVLQLGELPDPAPEAGEVLVRVRTSGVNPSDTKQRGGWRGAKPAFPRIVPHADGAGEIIAVGAGVERARIGERVWVYNGVGLYDARRAFGTAAELVALPADQAVALPDGLDFAQGACLGIPACTAHRAVFADGPVRGLTILIQGGAGAVGHYAVQFAAQAGARVIATVSSPEKAAHARAAGAHEIIDRKREDVVALVRALAGEAGVDRIIEVDFGANLAIDAELIRLNGTIASYSSTTAPEPTFPYYKLAFKGANLRLIQGYQLPPEARAAALADIARLKLIHTIDQRFPLAQIARAHERVESGKALGNVVVEIG